jgi:hypothetical protein
VILSQALGNKSNLKLDRDGGNPREAIKKALKPFWCLLMAIKWVNEFEKKLLRRKKLVKSFAQG